jgi:uncharacterized damage-inducible protein DinB
MTTTLQISFDSLERNRRELEAGLSALPQAELGFRPGPQRWSILMTLEHVVVSEEGIAAEMEQALNGLRPPQEARSPSAIRMVLFAMNQDVPVDVPAKELEPSGEPAIGELLERWRRARRSMQQSLNAILPADEALPVFRHPFGGPMDAGETLDFLIAHLDNHTRQIHRIRQAFASHEPHTGADPKSRAAQFSVKE